MPMGIPSLFRYIKDKYPRIIIDTDTIKTDALHIDFNALIHISTHPEDGRLKTQKEMFALLVFNINRLVEALKPRKVLHLATDGVAPRAKLNQQRARRFCSAQEARAQADFNEEFNEDIFDVNCLTPGTVFMHELRNHIISFIKYQQSTNPMYKNLEIVYSDDSVPGEGEHKILEYIRATDIDIKHSIYSPDADLMFLGLTLHKYDVHIIREDLEYILQFKKERCSNCGKNGHREDQCCKLRLERVLAVSIRRFRTYLKNEFDVVGKPYDLNRMIDDFILVCFLAGNDFLPTLPMLDVRFSAIEYLLNTMLKIFDGQHLTNKDGVNHERLNYFFFELSKSEDDLYAKKVRELDDVRCKLFPKKHFEKIDLTSREGKREYYGKKLYVFDDHQRNDLCYKYLKGMSWIFDYYQGRTNNWDYFYPQHYAPFPSDLAKLRNIRVSFYASRPLCRMKQLLLVLPPDSRSLVPRALQPIFDDQKLYPVKIRIDRFDKLWDWQSVVRIPLISVAKVVRFFDENEGKITKHEAERNKLGTDLLFVTSTKGTIGGKTFSGTVRYSVKNLYPVDTDSRFNDRHFVNKSVEISVNKFQPNGFVGGFNKEKEDNSPTPKKRLYSK